VLGFLLLTVYKKTAKTLIGLAGAAFIMGYCFHLVNFMALLLFPEKWAFLNGPIPYPLFYITPLIQFGAFFMLTLIITGAGILFIFYRWPEKKLAEDVPHYHFLRYHGYGLVLAGALLMPLFLFWDLYNLPGYSKSVGVFALSGLIIVAVFLLLSAVAWMLKHYKNPVPRFGIAVFIIAVALFGLAIGKDRTLQANANLESIEALTMDAEKARNDIVLKREELYSKSMEPDEKLGESIFNELCTACHAFDKKVMGPPFDSVLPKYIDKQDELISFIKNPTKKDPAYPAMANPGLTTIKVKSVVKFLMKRYKPDEETKDQNPDQPQEEPVKKTKKDNPGDSKE
jgi:cytochrome c